jgi:hypothetical protein
MSSFCYYPAGMKHCTLKMPQFIIGSIYQLNAEIEVVNDLPTIQPFPYQSILYRVAH